MEEQTTFSMKTEEAKELPLVKEGDYKAKVVRIEADQPGKFGNMVVFHFDIDGVEVPALSSQKLNPNTKLFQWAKILRGSELDVGEELKFSDLIGKTALCTVRNRPVKDETGAAQTRKGKPVLTSNIIEIRPVE